MQLCASGTAAIELALRAGRLAPGDEVAVCAFDFPGIRRTVELLGMKPLLVDCLPRSVAVDAEQLKLAATTQTRAAVVSHLYGALADMPSLRAWADANDVLLIEDACHCPGAVLAGRPVGNWGHVGILSFGGSKTLTSGHGGALLTADRRLAQRAAVIANRPSDSVPLSPLQAAALLPQLARLPEMKRKRIAAVSRLSTAVARYQTAGWWLNKQPSLASSPADMEPDYYKWAWFAPDARTRNRAVEVASDWNLPIRAGYRSAGKVSPRRCRIPFALPNADHAANCLLTIDHPVLSAEADLLARLGEGVEDVLRRALR